MKKYEELLSDIEDDIELMGSLHTVYAMEENGTLTGYDYLPEEPYTISITLKDLQEKIHQQLLYEKAYNCISIADKTAPKLAIIFPGIGYTADKPLLYYSSRIAKNYGYEIKTVSYGTLPNNIKGDPVKMRQAFDIAYKQTEKSLNGIDWESYCSILFISKSIGTVISSAYASRHKIKGKSILFTPLTDTFSFILPGSILFHGTNDPWADTSAIRMLAERKEVPLFPLAFRLNSSPHNTILIPSTTSFQKYNRNKLPSLPLNTSWK